MARTKKELKQDALPDSSDLPAALSPEPAAGAEIEAPEGELVQTLVGTLQAGPDFGPMGIWNADGNLWWSLVSGEVWATFHASVARAQLHNVTVLSGKDHFSIRMME